jgi:flagellar biogenesis protein FliO
MISPGFESLFGVLVVSALMLIFFFGLNKYKSKFLFKGSSELSISTQITIGYRQRLMLVKARNKTILLAISNDNTTVIESWNDQP